MHLLCSIVWWSETFQNEWKSNIWKSFILRNQNVKTTHSMISMSVKIVTKNELTALFTSISLTKLIYFFSFSFSLFVLDHFDIIIISRWIWKCVEEINNFFFMQHETPTFLLYNQKLYAHAIKSFLIHKNSVVHALFLSPFSLHDFLLFFRFSF